MIYYSNIFDKITVISIDYQFFILAKNLHFFISSQNMCMNLGKAL